MLLLAAFVLAIVSVMSNGHLRELFGMGEQRLTVLGDLRLPVRGEEGLYQTMLATQYPGNASTSFKIPIEEAAIVEGGLVRIGTEHSKASEYIFSIYEVTGSRKKRLFETAGRFPLNSWSLFRAETEPPIEKNGETEILYVLKPKNLWDRVACLIDNLKGTSWYEDFAFLPPNVFKKRMAGELNVILISFDTLRPDHLSCLGYSRPTTPHIDSFARQGILFTQAISPAPWTTPAHYSLFTGLYPSACWPNLGDTTIAGMLRDNGYYTIALTAGISMSAAYGLNKGFNRYLEFDSITNAEYPWLPWEPHEDGTRKIFERAADWLESNRDKKFFMFIHHYECHDPYESSHFLSSTSGDALLEQRKALYDGDIQRADKFFGSLLEELKRLNLFSNTIIILVSDHGEDFGDHFFEKDRIPPKTANPIPQISNVDHGHSVYDELIRVLMAFHIPGFKADKQRLENQVCLIDVLPTLLDYLGIRYEGPIQGVSLIELLQNGKRANDPPVISEFTEYGPEQKSVRMNGYKYVYTENPSQAQQKVGFANIPKHRLFDLRKDPKEKKNIYVERKELGEKYHQILGDTLEESQAINTRLRTSRRQVEKKSLPRDVLEKMKALGYLQ